jgi:hypothetical protein
MLPGSDGCLDCHGTGITDDDGSFTDMIGWPIPCHCTDSVPPIIQALIAILTAHAGPASHTAPTSRSALLSAPLSRSGI